MFKSALIVFIGLLNALLYVILIALFGRVLMTWLFPDEDTPIGNFLNMITEPFLIPVRALLNKFDLFNNSPIDMSVMITTMIILIIQMMLPSISI